MLIEDWRIVAAGRRHEAIVEAMIEHPPGRLVHIGVELTAGANEQRAQVVDAVGVVGMLVRVEDAIEPIDIRVQELLAQVRRGVDQHPGALALAALDQERTAAPAVLRILGITGAPAERRPRHAARRAAAQDGELEAHAAAAALRGTLENRRKKFSVVWAAISSSDTPRACASTLAVSTT